MSNFFGMGIFIINFIFPTRAI